MKILILGDIHGRLIWDDIIKKENPDLTIFLGDYISTHDDISEDQQLANLEDILNYKEENSDKVILLRGNHDCSVFPWGACYPPFYAIDKFPFERFEKLTQWVYIKDKIIFSHAGVSNTFLENNELSLEDLTKLKEFDDPRFGFTPKGFWDNTGTSLCQPPTWIRFWTLVDDMPEGYTQVVGHTTLMKCVQYNDGHNYKDLWLCDTLGDKQYLVIENNEFKPSIYESTSY